MLETAPAPVSAKLLEDRNHERLARAGSLLRRLETEGGADARRIIPALNELHREISNLLSECGIWVSMHPDKDVRDTAERLQRDASEFSQTAFQSTPIYEALARGDGLGPLERRFAELQRSDMKRAGVLLGPADRDRARTLRAELTKLGQDHARNIRDDTRYVQLESDRELEGLPADYVRAHTAGPDGVIRISTNPPDMSPVMTYAQSERLRKELQRASEDRAPANVEVLRLLTTARHALATLLGYPAWAHYNLEQQMVGTPDALVRFLDEVTEVAQASARAELAELLEEKRLDHPEATSVGTWERLYYTNRVKAKRFRFDAQEVRPYLEYRRVRQAILDLNAKLFGMAFAPVVHEELWHPSVESFDVTIDGRESGRISLDMHPREGKNKWFFNAPLVLGVGGLQRPHGVLCCNFPDPRATAGPALMEHQQVVTYFHEFGHLVHGLARGEVPYVRLSRTEGDFMEAPSTFLEEWIYDHAVLSSFATHIDTGAAIPAELVQRLRAARDFGRGIRVYEGLLLMARLSLALHDGTRTGVDPRSVSEDLEARYSLFESLPGTAFPASWEHMNTDFYSAAYYTYLWSLTIAKDLHTAFGSDLMDVAVARRYRERILAPGGTKPAADLVRDFLGRPFDLRAFNAWLAPRD
ncbi:MAG TPA: M3 family metallopeptidase [Candidatus Limnocylindria bacterium]|nr:M3 family metallopeptidase [Candidatus Limnocylindria bacterium]